MPAKCEIQVTARMRWWARPLLHLAERIIEFVVEHGPKVSKCALLLALASPAFALDAPGQPCGVSEPCPTSVSIVAGGVVSMGGGGGAGVRPLAMISVDMPASDALHSPRILTTLDLGALQGQTLDLGDPATFRTASLRLQILQPLAHLRLAPYIGAGFANRVERDPEPLERTARWWSIGIRGSWERGWMEVGAGQDQRLGGGGYWPTGHVRGALLVGTKAGVNAFLFGEAILALGYYPPNRIDSMTLGVGIGR